jgi:hypothetical protein
MTVRTFVSMALLMACEQSETIALPWPPKQEQCEATESSQEARLRQIGCEHRNTMRMLVYRQVLDLLIAEACAGGGCVPAEDQ